ncbi:hypothetical protein [Clostridium sp.]|uniref:hypothetical protein n=1 Tax=Clostridium sp. TaxID=1506 RepID=UPI003217460B
MNQNFINKARTIKRKEDILDSRVLEKFEIERRYLEKQDIIVPRRFINENE